MTDPAAPRPFGLRLQEAMEERSQLCVGIDPHPELLRQWGLADDEPGLTEFGRRVIEAAASQAAAVKPQVAFFEAAGPCGMAALATLNREAQQAGLLVIGDAKRGDIGSTMAGYARAWLHPDSPFRVDALTVSPYLGFGSLSPAVDAAQAYGAGLFVLALTSNPEGCEVQLARTGEAGTVAGDMVHAAQQALPGPEGALGSVGLVVGATTAAEAAAHGIDLTVGRPPILAPGYGAQGATVEDLRRGFGPVADQVLVSCSRQILRAGPGPAELVEVIGQTRRDVARIS